MRGSIPGGSSITAHFWEDFMSGSPTALIFIVLNGCLEPHGTKVNRDARRLSRSLLVFDCAPGTGDLNGCLALVETCETINTLCTGSLFVGMSPLHSMKMKQIQI